jgi:multicomponent Na+:H+ antiporter subunit F
MFVAALLAILVTMGLALARALAGPTTYDRIAAVNMFGTKTVLLIAVLAFFSGRSDLLDIALVYTLINFIGVVAALKLVTQGNFHSSDGDESEAKQGEPE